MHSNDLQPYLFRNISSTTIDKNGLAKAKSLRTMEVCMPITLEGNILFSTDEEKKLIETAMKLTKRLGMTRNRGFGKCIFKLKNDEEW